MGTLKVKGTHDIKSAKIPNMVGDVKKSHQERDPSLNGAALSFSAPLSQESGKGHKTGAQRTGNNKDSGRPLKDGERQGEKIK
jgi:hypothetical protein